MRGFLAVLLVVSSVAVAVVAGDPTGEASSASAEAEESSGTSSAADLKIFVEELYRPPFKAITIGWDRGEGTPVSSITPDGFPDMAALRAADFWDFSQNNSGAETASTSVDVDTSETCHVGDCGYSSAGRQLDRSDVNFDAPIPDDVVINNQVTEREDRASEVVVWLRAGTQKEGQTGSGGLGSGENRFCYDPLASKPEVPLWRFPHKDDATGRFYLQVGDSWSGLLDSSCTNDEWTVHIDPCGENCGFLDINCSYTAGSSFDPADCPDHAGTQSGEVLKGGVAKLPSGHVVNALLIRSVADFCVYAFSACGSPADQVRTAVYLWQAPHFGTVALLQSPQVVPPDLESFDTLDATNIRFGLYPPESIAVQDVTDTTVEISWDPGDDTHRIDDFKVYWDTDSGADSSYFFNSVDDPSQVVFDGNSATVSGLDLATTYYFTVTARFEYTDPSSGLPHIYESPLFPDRAWGDAIGGMPGAPGFVYPAEVRATTTGGPCPPAAEVSGLTVGKVEGGFQLCWDDVTPSDSCAERYDIRQADDPASAASFSSVAQTGATCWAGEPSGTYFLVTSRGTGGEGPWGHYGL